MPQAEQIIQLTNEYRTQQGLAPLKVNKQLSDAAQYRADDMAKTGLFSHDVATTSPNMKQAWGFMTNKGYNYQKAGENLATFYNDSKGTVDGWKNSLSHNKNLVNPDYTEIGVAVVPATRNGQQTSYVVQFFGTPKQIAEQKKEVKKVLKTNTIRVSPKKSVPIPSVLQPKFRSSQPLFMSIAKSTPITYGNPSH